MGGSRVSITLCQEDLICCSRAGVPTGELRGFDQESGLFCHFQWVRAAEGASTYPAR